MHKLASELIFISRIKRDGSGTEPVSVQELESMIWAKDHFTVTPLSLTLKTFIAIGFNSFVVKIKTDILNNKNK